MTRNIDRITEAVEAEPCRSAWSRGVKAYALELLQDMREGIDGGWLYDEDLQAPKLLEKALLNGAPDWAWYSEGGCALIYDEDIAGRLCAPWELRRTDRGRLRPNSRETWLDTQARALFQAAALIKRKAAAL